MLTYILRRLGLAVITLWLLSVIVFVAGQVLPGDPGRAILGPLAAQSRGARARPSARRRPAAAHPVLELDLRAGARQHGHLLHLPQRRWRRSSGRLWSTRSSWRRWRSSSSCRSASLGGVVAALRAGRGTDRVISLTGLSLATVPEFVSGDRAHRGLRGRAEVAAGHGRGRPGRVVRHPARPPDPARDAAGAGALRLHRADGAGRHDRGARLRLRAHRDPQGPAPPRGDPAPRAAQLAAADDHGHRHPDRLPDRRAGRDRDAVQLPGHRRADLHRRQQARTSRCSRRACSPSASSTWSPR